MLVNVHGPQEPQKRTGEPSSDLGTVKCQYVNAAFSGTEHKRRRQGDRRSNEVEQIVKQSMEVKHDKIYHNTQF